MKIAVVYHSQTGFTKRYAQWIAQATGADCFDAASARRQDFSGYDAIVFGGWLMAGSISKFGWFKGQLPKWAGKRLAVFAVGGTPAESPDIMPRLESLFTPEERRQVQLFYMPGGMNYEAMPAASRLMMRLFTKMLSGKKDKTEAEKGMLAYVAASYDLSDRRYIQPLVDWLQA